MVRLLIWLVAALLLAGCGEESPADVATGSARSLIESFTAGEHEDVCKQLAGGEGTLSLIEFARSKGSSTSDCEAASRFVLDGTPKAGRQGLNVEGAPTDVDVVGDGARVTWRNCCSFDLEEVGGKYVVADASALGLYFDIAGAGAGAGGGSPAGAASNDIVSTVRGRLDATAGSFSEQRFSEHVTDIEVDGPRVTLVTDLESTDTLVTGVCNAAADNRPDYSPNIPGASELLVETVDADPVRCADR